MVHVSSFPPVASPDARVLVLGSMPGTASLRAGRYYAHPRNAFWPILGDLCGFAANLDYELRLAALRTAGIALWDVLRSCRREGSLDSDIEKATAVANDFVGFFAQHPCVRVVLCNGGAAFEAFSRRVLPTLSVPAASLPVLRMPSTSPAHAGVSFAAKLADWREGLGEDAHPVERGCGIVPRSQGTRQGTDS